MTSIKIITKSKLTTKNYLTLHSTQKETLTILGKYNSNSNNSNNKINSSK